MSALKTLGPEDLAKLLHRSVETIKSDARRRPEVLPPRFKIPGSRRLVWLESDVIAWVERTKA
jgi:predicted DNA-binding transcriptional regulator AlpA